MKLKIAISILLLFLIVAPIPFSVEATRKGNFNIEDSGTQLKYTGNAKFALTSDKNTIKNEYNNNGKKIQETYSILYRADSAKNWKTITSLSEVRGTSNQLEKSLTLTEKGASSGKILYDLFDDKVKSEVSFDAPADGYYSIVWEIDFSGAFLPDKDSVTLLDQGYTVDWSDVTNSFGTIAQYDVIEDAKTGNKQLLITFDFGYLKAGSSLVMDPYVIVTDSTGGDIFNGLRMVQNSDGVLYYSYLKPVSTYNQVFIINSTDSGATWGTGKQVSTVSTRSAYQPSIAIDGNDCLHILWTQGTVDATTARVYYVNKTKTGAWSTPLVVSSNTMFDGQTQKNARVAVDQNDKIHFIWGGKTSTYSYEQIWYANLTKGVVSTPTRISTGPGMSTKTQSSPELSISNQLYVTWSGNTNQTNYQMVPVAMRSPSGGAWSLDLVVADPSNHCAGQFITSDATHAYVTYSYNSASDIYSYEYTYSTDTWSSSFLVTPSSFTYSAYPCIAVDTSGTQHIMFLGKDATYSANYVLCYAYKNSTTWSTPTVIANSTGVNIQMPIIRGSYYPSTNRISSNLDYTYVVSTTIYFDSFSLVSNNIPLIGDFEIPSTTYAGKWFNVNATILDENGVGDLENATVTLSNGVGLRWESGDSWAEDDPSGYLTLDSANCARSSVNSTAYKLSFRVKLGWGYPRGAFDIESSGTKVYDTLGASGSSGRVSASTFENDIIISGASVSDAHTNPSQSTTFTGTVYYRGTSTVPESMSGVTAKVSLGGTLKGSTTTFTGGTFSIPVTVEASVSAYNYTVWADAYRASTTNGTVEVKVDGIKLSANVVDVEAETVKVRALYALDSSPISGATLSFSGKTATTNSTGWATFDTGLYSSITANSTATGTSEPVYGLTTCTQTQMVSLQKLHITPFTVTSGHAITAQDWNDVTHKLSFESSGDLSVSVGDYGIPLTVDVNSNPWANWTYNSVDKRVLISGVGSLVVLTWDSSPPSGGTPGGGTPTIPPPEANDTDTDPIIPVIPTTPSLPTSTLVNIGLAAIVVTISAFFVNQEVKNKDPLKIWKGRSRSPRKSVDWRKRK